MDYTMTVFEGDETGVGFAPVDDLTIGIASTTLYEAFLALPRGLGVVPGGAGFAGP